MKSLTRGIDKFRTDQYSYVPQINIKFKYTENTKIRVPHKAKVPMKDGSYFKKESSLNPIVKQIL